MYPNWYYQLPRHATSSSYTNVNHWCMNIIGIINYLGMQLFQPYWMYLLHQLHKWYYHFLRHKIAIHIWYYQLRRQITTDNR